MDKRYDILHTVLSKAADQAEFGKGEERHGSELPFEQQILCNYMRKHGIAPAMWQVTKKADELLRFRGRTRVKRQLEELYGIIIYAAAAALVLSETE